MNSTFRNIFFKIPILNKLYYWAGVIKSAEKAKKNKIIGEHQSKGFEPIVNPNEVLQAQRVVKWFEDNGDETHRLNYDLNPNSIVLDVGGYKGEFARDIFCKYAPYIYIFEPITEFYDISVLRFCKNEKVRNFNFGLADKTFETMISLKDNSSSTHSLGDINTKIQLVSILDFVQEHDIKKVDLIKINIEGGEYDLLETLIAHSKITMFTNIQVQFHDFVIDNARRRMTALQNKLSETHVLTYQYDFVWENWKLKNDL